MSFKHIESHHDYTSFCDGQVKQFNNSIIVYKGWLAIAKLKPLSLFISLLLMLKKALDNGKMVK